jgi:hypothetical protein
VSETVIGPGEAVVRPVSGLYSSLTWTVLPKADREESPLTVTAHEPVQPPAMTLIWLPAPLREARPSMPVWAGGVVVSMFPDMSPYHLYVQ